MYTNIAIIFVVIIVILILRSISETKIRLPDDAGGGGPEPRPGGAGGFEPFEGNVGGVQYSAGMYGDDAVTVEIYLDDSLDEAVEIDIREGGALELDPADPLRPDAEALLALGAEYIDIGFNSDRVAAEFPASMKIDRAFAEKAAGCLIRLKEKAS